MFLPGRGNPFSFFRLLPVIVKELETFTVTVFPSLPERKPDQMFSVGEPFFQSGDIRSQMKSPTGQGEKGAVGEIIRDSLFVIETKDDFGTRTDPGKILAVPEFPLIRKVVRPGGRAPYL